MKKQTAGREALGEFAPKFAQLNDDILFGQVSVSYTHLDVYKRQLLTKSIAPTFCISSHTRMQSPQRIHLSGCLMIAGEDISFVPSIL